MDDWQLLEDYAVGHSEEAFRALVERHAGVVYHTALRQTGNAHAAEEVAQEVFIALARKAGKISRQATLHGWLFRATRFAVLNRMRAQANRERHERKAQTMPSTPATDDAESLWERITPHLDNALERLSETDRELVMIRFFGNKSHKDVALALGVSEDTARKRISRAVERLRMILARQGIAASAVALAAAFAAHGAKGAPAAVASSWANVAMAKAAAAGAAAPAGGLLTLLTVAKTLAVAAAIVAVLVVARAAITHPPPRVQTQAALKAPVPAPIPAPPPQPAIDRKTNAVSPATLDKVKAALHDPNPTEVYPNSAMKQAIAGLGDNPKSALPILEAALGDTDAEVRLRAIDGLGLLGPAAREAAPQVLAMLRDRELDGAIPQTTYTLTEFNGRTGTYPIYTDNLIFYSLARMHPAPEILTELGTMMKESPEIRHFVYQVTRQFGSTQRTMEAGGWLWEIAGENAKVLNDTFRPLLHDTNNSVRFIAALALAKALGDRADIGIFPAAAEMLRMDNDLMTADAMLLLDTSARNYDGEESPREVTLNAPRLGPYLNEIVSALAGTAYHAKVQSYRLRASKYLDELVPGFREHNPALAGELEQQHQSDDFANQVMSGEMTTPQIAQGLKKYPKAAPLIANYLARNGSNAAELMPSFQAALAALAPAPDASQGDRQAAINARMRLADAMQKLAPDQPKAIFTVMDTRALNRVLQDPALQSDSNRFQKIFAAAEAAEWPGAKPGLFDVSPGAVRRLLAAVKNVDAPTHDALAAKVKEIDRRFSENAAPRPE